MGTMDTRIDTLKAISEDRSYWRKRALTAEVERDCIENQHRDRMEVIEEYEKQIDLLTRKLALANQEADTFRKLWRSTVE